MRHTRVFCLCMVKQRKLVPRGKEWNRCADMQLRDKRHRKSMAQVSSSILVSESSWSWTVFLLLAFLRCLLSLNKLTLCLMLLAIKLDLINLETSQKLSWECIKTQRPKSKLVERNPNHTWFLLLSSFLTFESTIWNFVFPKSAEATFQTICVTYFAQILQEPILY